MVAAISVRVGAAILAMIALAPFGSGPIESGCELHGCARLAGLGRAVC